MPDGEWDKTTLLAFEREMLGLYVSDHPLLGRGAHRGREHRLLGGRAAQLRRRGTAERAARGGRADGQMVTVGGILSGVQRKVTRQGNPWATATLEDLEGAIEVLFFPAAYQQCSLLLAEDAIVIVKGRLDRREETPKLIAQEVSAPDLTVDQGGPFVVSMPVQRCVAPVVDRLREVLCTHPGAVRGAPETLQWPAGDDRPAG